MALIGEPYLVAITAAGTVRTTRLYRLTGGVFSQVDSLTGAAEAGIPPSRPKFAPNNLVLFSYDTVVRAQAGLFGARYLAGSLTPTQINIFAGGGTWRGDVLVAAFENLKMSGPNVTAPVLVGARIFAAGTNPTGMGRSGMLRESDMVLLSTLTGEVGVGGTVANGNRDIEFSPDGLLIAYTSSTGVSVYTFDYAFASGSRMRAQALSYLNGAASSPQRLKWSDAGDVLFNIVEGTKTLNLFSRVDTVMTFQNATVFAETPISISVFGPFVAVGLSYVDGTTQYRTRIYRRAGYELVPLTVLEGIGGDVLFFKDGTHLIDPLTSKAYARNGTVFTEDTAMMANVAVAQIGNLSPHVNAFYTQGMFYNGAAGDLIEGDVNLANLKVLLVNDLASFNKADATIAAAIGANEVYGNNWPQGGVTLQNVVRTKTEGGMIFGADKVSHEIFGGGITARAGIIYEGTRPLVFLDFMANRTIEANSLAEIDFSASGFAQVNTV